MQFKKTSSAAVNSGEKDMINGVMQKKPRKMTDYPASNVISYQALKKGSDSRPVICHLLQWISYHKQTQIYPWLNLARKNARNHALSTEWEYSSSLSNSKQMFNRRGIIVL